MKATGIRLSMPKAIAEIGLNCWSLRHDSATLGFLVAAVFSGIWYQVGKHISSNML